MKRLTIVCTLLLCFYVAWAQHPEQVKQVRYEKITWQLQPQDTAGLAEKIVNTYPTCFSSGFGLSLRERKESLAANHFRFEQTFSGIPIFGADISVTMDKQGRCRSLVNNLLQVQNPSSGHEMDHEALQDWVASQILIGQPEPWQNSRLVWMNVQGEMIPAYHVQHSHASTVHEVVLSSPALDTLHFRNLEVFHRGLSTDSTGTAYIFDPDPLTTAGVTYGGNYIDNFDSDSPYLDAQRQLVTLQDLAWNGTNFLLSGPHVLISDFEAPTIAPAVSPDGNFLFSRSQSGFEDVMVYHHIDQFQRYVQSLGFTNLLNAAIQADPHGLSGQDNSHFVPVGANGRLGFGEGGVDDAEDADVIIHEYGHALSYAAYQNGNSGTERNGLDEGIGDYLAASYSRNKSYNLWKNTYTWDGHNEFWAGRSASSPTLYPPTTPNIYTYGEIWASVLMEVYHQIGRTASDKVMLQAMYSFAPNLSLNDAAHLMLDADSLLYGGAHSEAYQSAFCRRGIFNGSNLGEECYVGISEVDSRQIEFSIHPNPANDHLDIEIGQLKTSFSCTILDLRGRELRSHEGKHEQERLDLSELPAGAYLLKIEAKSFLPGTKMFVIAR